MDGHVAAPTGPATGLGVPPFAEILHSAVAAPRSDEKTISRSSAVQAGGPMRGRLSNVRRLGSPPARGHNKDIVTYPSDRRADKRDVRAIVRIHRIAVEIAGRRISECANTRIGEREGRNPHARGIGRAALRKREES